MWNNVQTIYKNNINAGIFLIYFILEILLRV